MYLHGTGCATPNTADAKSLGMARSVEVIDKYARRAALPRGKRHGSGTDVILYPADLEIRSRRAATSPTSSGTSVASCWVISTAIPSALTLPSHSSPGDRWILARADAAIRCHAHYQRFRLTTRHRWSITLSGPISPMVRRQSSHDFTARSPAAMLPAPSLPMSSSGATTAPPIMPFITENLAPLPRETNERQRVTGYQSCIADWPKPQHLNKTLHPPPFRALQSLVTAVRTLRAEYGVAPGHTVSVVITRPSEAWQSLAHDANDLRFTKATASR